MEITRELLDELSQRAKTSERLRMNMDLRNSVDDTSQRMLNALEMGTKIPIHRHEQTSETICVLRGRIRQNIYRQEGDSDYVIAETFEVGADSDCPICNIPRNVWHNTECLEEGTVIFEAKDGAYKK